MKIKMGENISQRPETIVGHVFHIAVVPFNYFFEPETRKHLRNLAIKIFKGKLLSFEGHEDDQRDIWGISPEDHKFLSDRDILPENLVRLHIRTYHEEPVGLPAA